jgi:sphinganine-1-phosphate aldolase
VPVDENDRVDLAVLRSYAWQYKYQLVCIVGSAPSYPLGTLDPIREMAAIAKQIGVGMHVDCCLGGFVLNFLEDEAQTYLRIPGVTSLSCDTHKNGWAPKGNSVLITLPIKDRLLGRTNLFQYSIFAIPGWSGGIYGTPNNAGSQQCVASLQAVLAMASIGKEKYASIATRVSETTRTLAAIVGRHECLEVLGDANVNVCAFRIRNGCGLSKGAIYALVYEMDQLHVTLNIIAGERAHFCVTARSCADYEFIRVFEEVLATAIKRVQATDVEVKAGRTEFPGEGGLYGTFEAAMKPTKENTTSLTKRIQNHFVGGLGAKDGVRAYFYALADPFNTEVWGQAGQGKAVSKAST